MFITKLVLHLSKRMGFNGIKTFTYTPEHIYQIILGTNGSGKSSLIGELSPLPASGNDYFKGGYKQFEGTHKGRGYVLLSDFSSKKAGHHSFICDGEELNDGGTQAVQRQLVTEHFDFDKDLFELLTGQTSFREMSPNQRRYWLVRMADDNMEYAISLYNHTKKKHRDTGVVLKYLDEQITDLKKQHPDIENRIKELEEKQETLKQAHRALSKLDSVEPAMGVSELSNRIKQGFKKFEQLSNDIHNLPRPKGFTLTHPDMIPNEVTRTETRIDELTHQINELTDEHTLVKQTVQTLIDQEADNVGMLEQSLSDAEDTKQSHLDLITQFKPITDFDAMALSNAIDIVSDNLQEVVASLPDNSNNHFNREGLNTAKQKRDNLLEMITSLNVDIAKLEHVISHLQSDENVECPKCRTRFIPGMEAYDLTTTTNKRNALVDKKASIADDLKEVESYLSELNDYSAKHRQLRAIMSANPTLKPLWDKYLEYPLNEYHPNKYEVLFSLFNNEVSSYLEATKLQATIDEITQAINTVKSKSGNSKEYNKGTLEKIESRVEQLTKDKTELTGYLATLKDYERLYTTAKRLESEMLSTDGRLDDYIDKYFDALMQRFIATEIDEVNRQLGSIAYELSSNKMAIKSIEDLTDERERTAHQKELLSLLCDHLSPVNGLIADYSLKFITQFTDQMNAIINGIWTYDMQLQPLAISEDLTYKFPVYMAESDTQTPDINKLSTAQKRVVDFAFKILLVTYLELEDYPLYIDELTPNLDETHRVNITNYLKSFVDSGRCSQLFMSSHYVSGQNAFRDAQFVVINDSNLLNIPDAYNSNVELVYDGQ